MHHSGARPLACSRSPPPGSSSLTDPATPPPPPPSEGPGTPSTTGTQVLSRDLSTFLVEFSIALHKNQMYPPGHPHLNTALVGFNDRAPPPPAPRPPVRTCVAPD